jgi:hypothetical protein
MRYVAITSMDEKYYNHCGRVMIGSYSSHFFRNIPLYVYNEGNFTFKSKNTYAAGWNLGLEYDKFSERWSNKNERVHTFSKKAFSIIHAMYNVECDRLIWLDADTHFTDDFPKQLLDLISPDDTLSTHFGVKHNVDEQEFFSCETGFFILNKRHELFEEFRETYTNIYINDEYENLRRFYDGEVYGETVSRLIDCGAKMLELNPGQVHKTPIPRSIIAPYVSHYKAGLKDKIDFDELEKTIENEDQSI